MAAHDATAAGDQAAGGEHGEQPGASGQAQTAAAPVANVPEAMLGHGKHIILGISDERSF